MSFRITCYTLFDITQTGILNRSGPRVDQNYDDWVYKRNTQINFDTILQVINLRSQPEMISVPKKIGINFDDFDNFGFFFQQIEKETYPCWKFSFEIQHHSVFNDGEDELGYLYNDCDGVPMILCGKERSNLPTFLDVSPELKNIHFRINHE